MLEFKRDILDNSIWRIRHIEENRRFFEIGSE